MRTLGILGIPLDLGTNVRGSREFLIPILEKKKIPYKDFGNVLIPEDHPGTDPKKKELQGNRTCLYQFLCLSGIN